LAESCKLQFIDTLIKTNNNQQKAMQNSSHQCENALKSYELNSEQILPMQESIILVDDIVDSRWTMTVCGHILMENGFKKVIPFALADSSQKED
jgi:ATP-dependent DNA helicase RecQ